MACDYAFNDFFSLDDLPKFFTPFHKKVLLEWFARKIWNIRQEILEEFRCKSYDPLLITSGEKVAYSYVFNLIGNGRYHRFEDLKDVESWLEAELLFTIAEIVMEDPKYVLAKILKLLSENPQVKCIEYLGWIEEEIRKRQQRH